MNIFEQILNWLKGVSKTPDPDIGDAGQLPQKNDSNRKDNTINTPIMLNTITLSSDLETLYLIDNNRAIEFPLNSKEGILVGTLNGQITVVSAIAPPKEEDDEPIGDGENDLASPVGTLAKAKGGVLNPKSVTVSAKKGQYTTFFNGKLKIMCLIGFGDIDISITESEELEPQFFIFDLNDRVVNIRKKENSIVFTTLKRD